MVLSATLRRGCTAFGPHWCCRRVSPLPGPTHCGSGDHRVWCRVAGWDGARPLGDDLGLFATPVATLMVVERRAEPVTYETATPEQLAEARENFRRKLAEARE